MNIPASNKNILDFLKFDISKFFSSQYTEVGVEDTPAIQVVDYETKLDYKEFDIFDTIRLRVLFDKMNITGETHVNASFRCKKRRTNKEDLIFLVNEIAGSFGSDNTGKRIWTDSDDEDFGNNVFNRTWSSGIGDNFVVINFDEVRGLELNVLFVNNLLRNIGKAIEF